MMQFLNKLKIVATFFLFLLPITASAIDPSSSSHVIKSADLNNDGHLDYLFEGQDKFILIAVNKIRTPIIVNKPDVLLQSKPDGRFDVITGVSEVIASSKIWQPSTTSTLAVNLDGNEHGDLILLTSGHDHRGVTIYGTAGDDLVIGNYIDEALIGSTAVNDFDSITVQDSDNNGTDDLLFFDNGTVIALAYSNGNQFSSVTQTESSEPFSVAGQWRYVEETDQDVFSPVPPNSAGISVNRLDSFDITDRPAIISNFAGTAWTENGDVTQDAAKTIVIITDSVNLTQPVKVLGSKADLLFITESPTGGFSCNNCSFEGIYRISVVTQGSTSPISTVTTDLGAFMPGSNTSASITNLKAPNAIGLDILTENINTNASADLTQRVSIDEDGLDATQDPVINDPNGDLTSSSGSINLLLGDIEWGYHSNEITSSPTAGIDAKTITGTFDAKTIRIGSPSTLIVDVNSTTITDYATAVSYRGSIFLPEESVDYQSLAGNLYVKGLINSNGDVRYKTKGKLTIQTDQTTLHGDLVKAVAGGELEIANGYKLVGNNIDIGTSKLINSGSIQAVDKLEIFSKGAILNQYGGEMFGEHIHLDANGIIRNGSRTPYISSSETLLNSSDSLITQTIGLGTVAGTFYRIPEGVDVNTTTLPLQTLQTAHIAGNHITMKAHAIENINPYYLHVRGQDQIDLQRDKVSQVGIYAEDSMKLQATEYIANSSALMYLNQPGDMKLEARYIFNERYRLALSLDYDSTTTTIDGVENTTERLGTGTIFYSPPGVMRSSGNLEAKATQNANSYFTNNAGYLEVFGQVNIDSPKLISRGYSNQEMKKSTTDGGTTTVQKRVVKLRWTVEVDNPDIIVTDFGSISELDSLFYAGNDLYASQSNSTIETLSAFDAKVTSLVSHLQTNGLTWKSQTNQLGIAEINAIGSIYQSGAPDPVTVLSPQPATIYPDIMVCRGIIELACDRYIIHQTGYSSYGNSNLVESSIDAIKTTGQITFNTQVNHNVEENLYPTSCSSLSGGNISTWCTEPPVHDTYRLKTEQVDTRVTHFNLFDELKAYQQNSAPQISIWGNEKHWWNQ